MGFCLQPSSFLLDSGAISFQFVESCDGKLVISFKTVHLDISPIHEKPFNFFPFSIHPVFFIQIHLSQFFDLALYCGDLLMDFHILMLLDDQMVLFLQLFNLVLQNVDQFLTIFDLLVHGFLVDLLADYSRAFLGLDILN